MAEEKDQPTTPQEPRGFGEHARGLAGEYAHEQGWGLNEEERTRLPRGKQPEFGGKDYEYGAQDFGDEPTDPAAAGISGEESDLLKASRPNDEED